MNIFLLSGLVSMSLPVGGGVFAVGQWWRARRRLERAFTEGRERRRWPVTP